MKTRIASGLVGLAVAATALFGAYPAQASTSTSVVGVQASASQLAIVPFREPVPACDDQIQLVRNNNQIRAVGVDVRVFPPSYPYGLITVQDITSSNVKGYRPPAYPLLEALFHRSENSTVRWLYGWNGPVTEAARDVTLAASAPAGRALVTSGLWADESDAQLSALMAANSLQRSRLFRSAAVDAAMKDMLWLPRPFTIDGKYTQVMMSQIGECTVAYAVDVPAQFAAAWEKTSELESIDTIDTIGATKYLIDPLEMHSYPSLNEQTYRVMSIVDFYPAQED